MSTSIQRRALATIVSPRVHFTAYLKGIVVDNNIRYDVYDCTHGFYHGTLYLPEGMTVGNVGMFSTKDDFENVSVHITNYSLLTTEDYKLLDTVMDGKHGCMYIATGKFYED